MASAIDVSEDVARELGISRAQVQRTLALLDGGATVPFVARYRKEATGGLDEVAIAKVRDLRDARVEVEERRATILASIAEQGKLTAELRGKIERARTKTELEDLYVPYRPKRKTRASIARGRGEC